MNGALLGIGIDSVDIARFASVLERRPNVAARLFTSGEQSYAHGQVNPVPSLAARFAVKEATMKALRVGIGAFAWTDIEVIRAPLQSPELSVTGRAAVLAAALGVAGWHVSITHTGTVASAVVAAVA